MSFYSLAGVLYYTVEACGSFGNAQWQTLDHDLCRRERLGTELALPAAKMQRRRRRQSAS